MGAVVRKIARGIDHAIKKTNFLCNDFKIRGSTYDGSSIP
jgi:hypothetical protein